MTPKMNLGNENSTTFTIPQGLVIDTRQPEKVPFVSESLEFHAARILLLLAYAGGKKATIVGRTKLAKMDFFVRYASYLAKAAALYRVEAARPVSPRPESPMIRYKYGPWDKKYYDVFALLVSKQLISILPSSKGDEFSLTERGRFAVGELHGPEFVEVIERCRLVYKLFGGRTGTEIKNFIYDNFPEITARRIGAEIEQ